MNQMDTGLLLVRLLFFGIFALAGIAKFLDLKGSVKAFKEFGIPAGLALPSSIALSVFEIVIALLFLSVETAWFGAIGAAALLLLFISQMIYQLAKGNAPDCHCFGQLHSAPVSKVSVARNIVFGSLALFLVWRGAGGQGLSLSDPRLDVMQLAFGVAIVSLLITVLFYLKTLIAQQAELVKRIELVELVARDGGTVERDDVGHPHEGLPIGAVFPDFELSDLNGENVSLDGLIAKQKPALFVFVSPTCTPCKALLPEFEQWVDELGEKVNLIFVSNGTLDENQVKFSDVPSLTILLQNKRELADAVRAKWTPTAVFMNANGRIASHVAAGDTAIRALVEQIKTEDLKNEFTHFANLNGHQHENKIGSDAPDFKLDATSGRALTTADLKGRETLALFWSHSCGYCGLMADELRDWDLTKGIDAPQLVVFSDGETAANEALGLTSTVLFDPEHKTANELGRYGTPSAVLINENGKIISETAVGAPDIWSLIGKRK